MAASVSSGPVVALGGLTGAPAGMQPTEYAQQIGPSMFYGGVGIPAIVQGANKDDVNPGVVPAIYMQTPIQTIYAVAVAGGAALTVAGNATGGVPLVNVSTFAAGVAPGTAAMLAGNVVSNAVGLDIAIDKAAVTTSNNVITLAKVANIWRYSKGMWLAIAGAGPGGSTLFAQVLAVGTPANGQITLSVIPNTAQAAGEVGLTNRYSLYRYGNPPPSGVSDFAASGMGRFLIPESALARGVGVTVAAGGGASVLIQGLDIYNQPQSEMIAAVGGATTYGKKTYGVFISATPQTSDAHAYTVVTSDLFGFPISVVPNAPPPTISLGATAQTGTLVAIQYADQTSPATTTTGDPRGAFQMSTKGPNAGVTGTGPDGSSIISVTQTISALAAVTGSMLNPGPLFGVPTV